MIDGAYWDELEAEWQSLDVPPALAAMAAALAEHLAADEGRFDSSFLPMAHAAASALHVAFPDRCMLAGQDEYLDRPT